MAACLEDERFIRGFPFANFHLYVIFDMYNSLSGFCVDFFVLCCVKTIRLFATEKKKTVLNKRRPKKHSYSKDGLLITLWFLAYKNMLVGKISASQQSKII